MLMVLMRSQLKIPIGKWWEADGVGKSLSNPKDYDLDRKPIRQFPYSYFRIGNAIVKLNIENGGRPTESGNLFLIQKIKT